MELELDYSGIYTIYFENTSIHTNTPTKHTHKQQLIHTCTPSYFKKNHY